ncbi:biotin-protein ligase [Sordaria brevicollis]|uniref:Biotin-protein ligase n=1 Tax=Sordaria brevicollis TaxID=83679 RepID=A0AAE0UF74_SORBR|nr:biotin-protein ligase [Sordaria brevicollis]
MATAPKTEQRVLNIHVYSDKGVTRKALRQCVDSLKRLAGPNYAVGLITDRTLMSQPWASTCALMVFPGGRDLDFCRGLNGAGNRAIIDYVRNGGAYLGFCAGGYYGSAQCWFEMEGPNMDVKGPRELAFYPGTCAGPAFKGFQYDSEAGAKAASLRIRKQAFANSHALPDVFKSYYNGGGVFVGAENMEVHGVEILADYADDIDVSTGNSQAAVVFCKVGKGRAILTGPHPEFSGTSLYPKTDIPGYDKLVEEVTADESARLDFLAACLGKLGLSLPSKEAWGDVPQPTNMLELFCSEDDIAPLLNRFTWKYAVATNGDAWFEPQPGQNVFHLEWTVDGSWSNDYDIPNYHDKPVYRINVGSKMTGMELESPERRFSYDIFSASLQEFRRLELDSKVTTWKEALGTHGRCPTLRWGDYLMCGETVTSTNTILSGNPGFVANLESGFTFTATRQVAGRGRGDNTWVSPPGCLIMSTVINLEAGTRLPYFMNHVAAIAIVEAIKGYDHTYDVYQKLDVKIKWPNDVYVRDPSKPDEPAYVKVCGILGQCSYNQRASKLQIVLGIGINTNNAQPTTSLDALLKWTASLLGGDKTPPPPFKIERLVARILTCLEILCDHFVREGFSEELEELYYKHWLHTNQIVTLEDEDGVKARVVGITRDEGQLVVEEVIEDGIELNSWKATGTMFQLHTDHNGFDYWRGLIKKKV